MTDKVTNACPIQNCDKVSTIIEKFENRSYLQPNNNVESVIDKIKDFSNWFSSTGRLNLFSVDNVEHKEQLMFLLLGLKKNVKYALTEVYKLSGQQNQTYTCRICQEKLDVTPPKDICAVLEEHEHFQEICSFSLVPDIMEPEGQDEDFSKAESSDTSSETSEATLVYEEQGELNDFKFSFEIKYDPQVESNYYPKNLTCAAQKHDNINEHTVQRHSNTSVVCLLCPCNVLPKGKVAKVTPFLIRSHATGHRHMKNASDCMNISSLWRYHEFWRKQEPPVQAQQAYFVPEVAGTVAKCQLCRELVGYPYVISHIKGDTHKNAVMNLFKTHSNKPNAPYLLNLQVQVYNGVAVQETDVNKTPDQVVPAKKEVPKCSITQAIFDFSDSARIIAPERFKDHLPFLERAERNTLYCKACKTKITESEGEFKNHVTSPYHRQISGVKSKFTYYCEICDFYVKDETIWGQHIYLGTNRHSLIPEHRRKKSAEYECKTCLLVIYGDHLSLSRHISNSRGGRAKKKKVEITLPHTVIRMFRSTDFIENEAERVLEEANYISENQENTKECCDDLEKVLSEIYPGCKAYPFGSRISGLGNNKSDLDIFLDVSGDMYTGTKDQDGATQEQFVKKAAKLLKLYKDEFNYVVPIPSARTPIIRLHHCYTDLDCDISFRHGLGVENTKLLRFYISLQPITQQFILLLKKWSDYCKLNENITNYGLAIMAIFLMQIGGYLFPISLLRNYNPEKSLVIDGWETIKYTVSVEEMKQFLKPYTGNVKQLLRDFFDLFSQFDYENLVICPLLGCTFPKMLFTEPPDGSHLPAEMISYVTRTKEDPKEMFRSLSPFCIQDPFDLSHNLTKACQHGTIHKFKMLCKLSKEYLDAMK